MTEDLEEQFDDQEERRHHDRTRLIVDVYFNGQDATGVASTKDISLGGFYMNTKADIPEGGKLVVRIPIAANKEIICNAEVVYANPGAGIGVRFTDLSDEARSMLAQELKHV